MRIKKQTRIKEQKEKLLVQLMDLEEQLIWVSNEETLEQKKIKKEIEKQYRKISKKLKELNEIESGVIK